MNDALPRSVRMGLNDPFAELTGPLAAARRLSFEVVASERMSPTMQRILLTAPELAGFRYEPGQDVMLLVGAVGTRPIRRRYTIRALDRAALTLNVVRHGEGPGEQWVRSARPGDKIEGIGPRGKISTSLEADWHLFLGDESALPAILTMTESLPGDAVATLAIEIPEPEDEQELLAPARTRLSWLHRLGRPAGDPALLSAEAAEVEFGGGNGHAYVFGEAAVVSALREILADRGLRQDQISPKAYWGRGRGNAGHGEPDLSARLAGDQPFALIGRRHVSYWFRRGARRARRAGRRGVGNGGRDVRRPVKRLRADADARDRRRWQDSPA